MSKQNISVTPNYVKPCTFGNPFTSLTTLMSQKIVQLSKKKNSSNEPKIVLRKTNSSNEQKK